MLNYQNITDEIISGLNYKPTLLLHSCCAPCSSYCLEYLSEYFCITVFYYNPNIYPADEYSNRLKEQSEFVKKTDFCKGINVISTHYKPEEFYNAVKGLEKIPEGGARCFACYELRLEKTAIKAKELGFEYFTTTLSISPQKNSEKLNSIGREIAKKYELKYLFSDFKKKNGFKRSTELCSQYGIYRQNYCGCKFSLKERNLK